MTPTLIFRSRNGEFYEDVGDGEETLLINPANNREPYDEYEEEASCFRGDADGGGISITVSSTEGCPQDQF
jgi:hypothetical protein